MQQLAPVAIFVYNRLSNTKKVINSLRNNFLSSETEIFIFSDAPKNKKNEKSVSNIRKYLKTITGFKSVVIIEREENFYIERNIIEGVTDIINKYGKIIVLEDDGVTAKNFLNYMNDALNFYENEQRIMHIASFTFIKMPDDYKKTILWQYPENSGGGWGTWKNRWDKFVWFKEEKDALLELSNEQKNKIELNGSFKCLNNLKLRPIPWDICWYIAIIKNNGLAVNPLKSLMKNVGLYNGTHFSIFNKLLGKHPMDIKLTDNQEIIFEKELIENTEATKLLEEFYKKISNRKLNRLFKKIKNITTSFIK